MILQDKERLERLQAAMRIPGKKSLLVMLASNHEFAPMMKCLLKNGWQLGEDGDSFLPLQEALRMGNVAGVDVILTHCPSSSNLYEGKITGGRSPLVVALSSKNVTLTIATMVSMLLQYGANPDVACGRTNKTPLGLACASANVSAVHELLSHGANPNLIQESHKRDFPLFLSASATRA